MDFLEEAQKKLAAHEGKPMGLAAREKEATDLAALLLREALKKQTRKEKKRQRELSKMMIDPRGKAFIMMMTDQCFRSHKSKRVADQLVYLLHQLGIPHYLGLFKRLGLSLFKVFGRSLHFILVPIVRNQLRRETSSVILPGEKKALLEHITKRREEGVRLNLNYLGEAILGEEEANRRLEIYLQSLEQENVDYVSIKISTIFSQINELEWHHTMEVLSERLRRLYRKAKEHKRKQPDGTEEYKFVNLDMEAYKDLHLTKELFKKVLSEEEFFDLSAGIVLQAYLPDSYDIQQELTEWALQRVARRGAPIKIRIVKGANLAMEKVEAGLHNWKQAPYKTKKEVDANYKRMLLYGSKPGHIDAVRLGIASHNLFDIAFALLLSAEHQIQHGVTFEMLEGMADHIRRVVQKLSGDILLYCPVAKKEDFQSAIAYLIRRLDENTGPENFLRHIFGLKPGTSAWEEQVVLFTDACKQAELVSSEPRRDQNRFDPPKHLSIEQPFHLEPETDFDLPQNQKWAHEIVEQWQKKSLDPIPLVIGGREIFHEQKGEGIEPADPHKTNYEYTFASWEDLNLALNIAKETEEVWREKSAQDRAELLSKVAEKLRENRQNLIGAMMRDGGKSLLETEPEIAEAIDFVEYYLRSMLAFDKRDDLNFSPLGTILVAPPWNFPVSIPCGGLSAALVTGNCVLFKPAPEAVLSGWILVNLFWEAGIPKNVLQFINCVDDPIGTQLIQDERLDGVILTGGTPTAKHFMEIRPRLHLNAETGGKNALIVTALADRDLAIEDFLHSAFGHSGQKCSACSLLILEKELYDDPNFIRQLKDAVESLPVGSNWDIASKVVPLIKPPSDILLKGLTKLEKGESWLVEPKQDPNNPHLWSPGLKLGVKEKSFMHQTELFGPCVGVMRAKDLDEALRFVNGTNYGLTSGIHTLDEREVEKWRKEIVAGNCYVNRTITGAIVERQPFGGTKESNFGFGSKAGGPNYILQFLHKKQVSLPKEKAPMPDTIGALTTFLDQLDLSAEELGTWFASTANYVHFAKEFSKFRDPQKVLGQDNFQLYRPREKMAYRIQKEDHPLDLLRILVAAIACNTSLTVSYHPTECPLEIEDEWHQKLSPLLFVRETSTEFMARVQWSTFDRVRFASSPTPEIIQSASESITYLACEPVLASGRIELLHYLREVSLSINYHRYGNLGLREGEIRSNIL